MKILLAVVFCAAGLLAQSPTVQIINMNSQSPMRQILPFGSLQPFVEVFVYGDKSSQKYEATLTYTDMSGNKQVSVQSYNSDASGTTTFAFMVDAASASVTVRGFSANGVVLQSQ